MREMLPEISLDATESEVRQEILSVLQTSVEIDLEECGVFDFNFINPSAKVACVPTLTPETTMNCRTLKKLAGNGAVYIRLTKDFEGVVYGDLDEEHKKIKQPHSTSRESPIQVTQPSPGTPLNQLLSPATSLDQPLPPATPINQPLPSVTPLTSRHQ